MKATFDLPDDLYRNVKARSALEGRPTRAVLIELFQDWLSSSSEPPSAPPNAPSPEELTQFPWLAISQKYVDAGTSSEFYH